tara:strand:+ start:1052 stop:1168 length:117 start_codon:yes stop_codon:yes gene_type:complete
LLDGEMTELGLRYWFAKPANIFDVPWVQIPFSPPAEIK